MNTLETDIADYLAHLRAQLKQIEREVTGMALVEDQVWDENGIHVVSDYDEPTSTFIAHARTAYPASIAREIRLIEAMWTIVSQDNASIEDIRATYGVEYSPPPCVLETALRDIIAEWKGANQ